MDSANHFVVGVRGEQIVVGYPPLKPISKEEALNLAAWLRCLADPAGEQFDKLIQEIQTT